MGPQRKKIRHDFLDISHFWPRSFCDVSLVTMLALEEVSVIMVLREQNCFGQEEQHSKDDRWL